MALSKLLIFAKAPIAGHAKSRMIPLLGAEGAAQLQQEITHWMLARLMVSQQHHFKYDIELWVASDIDHPFFKACVTEFGIKLMLQQGDDLGERQYLALVSALAESDHVVVIGSDVVSLTAIDIQSAFNGLSQGEELVIAPAEDGGYGLIGASRIDWEIFEGISWGGEQVYQGMARNLNHLGYRWQRLAEVWDLDRPDDLRRLGREPGLPAAIYGLLK
jgi:rSAM/selenodomain-associated transferase 1